MLGTWAGRQRVFAAVADEGGQAPPAQQQSSDDEGGSPSASSPPQRVPLPGPGRTQRPAAWEQHPKDSEDSELHAAWRWRFSRKWATEQQKQVGAGGRPATSRGALPAQPAGLALVGAWHLHSRCDPGALLLTCLPACAMPTSPQFDPEYGNNGSPAEEWSHAMQVGASWPRSRPAGPPLRLLLWPEHHHAVLAPCTPQFMKTANGGLNLQIDRAVSSTDQYHSAGNSVGQGSLNSTSLSHSLIIDGSVSSPTLLSSEATATSQIVNVARKAQHLMRHQQEIERQVLER